MKPTAPRSALNEEATVADRFQRHFKARARTLRACLVTRSVLFALCAGAGVAALAALCVWWFNSLALRPYVWLVMGAAAGLGVLLGVRRRWSDEAVALYLDGRLASREVVATALELARQPPSSETDADTPRRAPASHTLVMERATALLAAAPDGLAPRVLARWHLIAPLTLAGAVVVTMLEPRTSALAAAPPVGVAEVRSNDVAGLREIEALAAAPARDAAQHVACATSAGARASSEKSWHREWNAGKRSARSEGCATTSPRNA
jgi:hypothetical protein